MAAETVVELPFNSEEVVPQSPGLHLEIDPSSRQSTDRYHGSAPLGRLARVRYTLESPLSYASSDVVDIYVNGIVAPGSLYAPVRRAGTQLGKYGVSFETGGTMLSALSPRDLLHPEKFRQEGLGVLMDDIQKKFGQQLRFRLKSHSTGLRTAIGAAEASPERIDSVTSIGGAAIDGIMIADYISRMPNFADEEVVPNADILQHQFAHTRAVSDFFWYNLAGFNLPRLGVEAWSIANDDVKERFVALGDLDVRSAILDGEADRLTHNSTVPDGIGRLVDLHRMHPEPLFGHLGPQVFALETAMELHSIDEELHPNEVIAPRRFAVRAMARGAALRHPDEDTPLLSKAS